MNEKTVRETIDRVVEQATHQPQVRFDNITDEDIFRVCCMLHTTPSKLSEVATDMDVLFLVYALRERDRRERERV
jgi:hypothetical protein